MRHRLSIGVRPASSQENSTSSVKRRAYFTAPTAISNTWSNERFSLLSTWIVDVEINVWIRNWSATDKACAAASMSFSSARDNAQTRLFLMVRAMVCTDSKSPGDETGKPTSITSTPRRSSAMAICNFSLTERLAANACSPSRKVVSNIITLLDISLLHGTSPFII